MVERTDTREFNAMQRVKRRFFAMRNGDLAQQMAELAGRRYKINFGLNLPQITEIARDFMPGGCEIVDIETEGFDRCEFARQLRANTTTRESMLIAPMLFPPEQLTVEEALEWCTTFTPTPEVADILCMKLLRNHPAAAQIAIQLLEADGDHAASLLNYAGLRLLLNLLIIGRIEPPKVRAALASLPNDAALQQSRLTANVYRQLTDELEYC